MNFLSSHFVALLMSAFLTFFLCVPLSFGDVQLLIDFGGTEDENKFGPTGWNTLATDVYTSYKDIGLDGTVGGSNGQYDYQVISGSARPFLEGEVVSATWMNLRDSEIVFTPRISFDDPDRPGGAGTWHDMTQVTLTPYSTARSTFTISAGIAGTYSLVNISRNIGNRDFICDRIEIGREIDIIAPSRVSGLTGWAESENKVALDWDDTTDDVGVTGYVIYRDSDPVGGSIGSRYVDMNREEGRQYTYRVAAFDLDGNASETSDEVTVTTKVSNNDWENRLDQYFDVVDTFDLINDWSGPLDDYVVYENNPEAFPTLVTGDPSRWTFYAGAAPLRRSIQDGDEVFWDWIERRSTDDVWLGRGKSACISYGSGRDNGLSQGPSRLAFKIGDSPADGYSDDVYVFFMVKIPKAFFKWQENGLPVWNKFIKTLVISSGFKSVRYLGTDQEHEWLESRGAKSQVLHEYGLNYQVYNYNTYGGHLMVLNSRGITGADHSYYSGGTWGETGTSASPYYYFDVHLENPVTNSEWFALEYHVKGNTPNAQTGRYTDAFEGSVLVDDTKSWTPDSMTGWMLYNKTSCDDGNRPGCSCAVQGNTTTTITCVPPGAGEDPVVWLPERVEGETMVAADAYLATPANGKFEVWAYDRNGNVLGYDGTIHATNIVDGHTPFNHKWNKFDWGGNRFSGFYCSALVGSHTGASSSNSMTDDETEFYIEDGYPGNHTGETLKNRSDMSACTDSSECDENTCRCADNSPCCSQCVVAYHDDHTMTCTEPLAGGTKNRFDPGDQYWLSNPLCQFGPLDYYFIDDVIVNDERIGSVYFSLVNGKQAPKAPINLRVVP